VPRTRLEGHGRAQDRGGGKRIENEECGRRSVQAQEDATAHHRTTHTEKKRRTLFCFGFKYIGGRLGREKKRQRRVGERDRVSG
jgi:hypothetical protein